MTLRYGALLIAWVLASFAAGPIQAQDSDRPRAFEEFRGTWLLDDAAGTAGIRHIANRAGQRVTVDSLGLSLARTLVIETTATEMSLAKDSSLPEIYRFDGTETATRDPRTGAPLATRFTFTLVAEALALTSRLSRCCDAGGRSTTEIVTDLYDLTEWNVLTVQRQLSYLRPEGYLRNLSGLRNNSQTIIYRRQQPPQP
jgi:hypothetical protein